MQQVEIPFRQWLPDQPDHNNPGLVEAKNVVSLPSGYNPIKGPSAPDASASSLDWSRGSHLYRYEYDTGLTEANGPDRGFVYVENNTLWLLDYDGATVETLANPRASRDASFARVGSKLYVGTQRVNNVGTVTAPMTSVELRSDLGSPRIVSTGVQLGANLARVGPFLMTGGLVSSTSFINPRAFSWSGFNAPEDWTVSELTLAGFAFIETPHLGRITAIVGARTPMIFQERGITRINYVGPPKIWSQRLISEKYGVNTPAAIIDDGEFYYFMNSFGAYATNGSTVTEISIGSVSKWIREKTKGYAVRIHGTYFPEFRAVVWGFETPDDTVTSDPWPYTLIYSTETRQFTYGDFAYYGAAFGEIRTQRTSGAEDENVQFSMVPQSGVSTDSKLSALSGDTLEATLTTGHLASAGKRTLVDGVEPIYEGSGATVALSGKERTRDAASFSAYQAEESASGVGEITSDARSTATSVKFAAGETWSDFSGVVANVGTAGER